MYNLKFNHSWLLLLQTYLETNVLRINVIELQWVTMVRIFGFHSHTQNPENDDIYALTRKRHVTP